MTMWTRLRYMVEWFRRPAITVALSADDVGISVRRSDRTEAVQVPWDDVDKIETFKLDLLTYDDVRLVFLVNDFQYELSEEDPGFVDVMIKMREKFPSIPESWYFDVRETAFARNHQLLWSRDVPG